MPRLNEFTGTHYGQAMVVCGLGRSINSFRHPERFHTIGVNDIGRAFTPTYLFVMDSPASFGPERFHYIEKSRASYIFTDHNLGLDRENIVRLSIRESPAPRFDDPDRLYMTGRPPTSPFLAICLAAHMGAKAIGVIGVDFLDHHFFAADGQHKLAKGLAGINRRFYQLGSALLERGVKVFNLSAESRLNAFPRLSEDALHALQKSAISRSWSRPARRLCLRADSQPGQNLQRLARLINSKTPVSCRIIAPQSPDIRTASTPEIEQDVWKASVRIDCAELCLPDMASVNGDFPAMWARELRPLLFQESHRIAAKPRRPLSLSILVSQGLATSEEAIGTIESLRKDLSSRDECTVIGNRQLPPSGESLLRAYERVRFVAPRPSESHIAARDRIARQSLKDILLFTDANIQIAPSLQEDWAGPLLSAFEDPSIAAVGPAIADLYDPSFKGYGMRWADGGLDTTWLPKEGRKPYPAPLLPGVFLAVRRSAFEQVGGLDAAMLGDLGDDLELCFRLWTQGFRCVVAPALEVSWMNAFAAGAIRRSDYWGSLLYNLLRLASVHFGAARLKDFTSRVSSDPLYPSALARLSKSNAAARRRVFRALRRHSDDGFFQQFPIPS